MRITLIGDSIRGGYAPYVIDMLPGCVVISENENGGDSRNLPAHVKEWFIEPAPDIIHFNCGLHDLRTRQKDGSHQVALDEYGGNLRQLVARLKTLSGVTLVWATTTPVIDERHQHRFDHMPGEKAVFDYRYNRDVDAYNKAARAIMEAEGIPIDDLHAVVVANGVERIVSGDGVHMTPEGSRILAGQVVKFLQPFIKAARDD